VTHDLLLASVGVRAALGAVLGVIVGSFLGALITRWPAGRSVLRGRSHCDACDAPLGIVDLVPVLSALVLRLRCRRCGARIDPFHMVAEIGGGIIGACALAFSTGPVAALGWCLAGWMLVALALLDARHFWLPDALTLPLAFCGFVLGPWCLPVAMQDRWIGAAAGYGALMIVALTYRRWRGRDGLGMGDAKLLGAIGAWSGWLALPLVLLLASVGGLLWALIAMLAGRDISGSTRLPLGTLLALAAGPAIWLAHELYPGLA